MTDSNPHKCCGNLQIFWHIQFKTFAVFNLTKYPFNENIARVQNCPDITKKTSFCLFYTDIILIKCFWSLKSHSVWLSYTDKEPGQLKRREYLPRLLWKQSSLVGSDHTPFVHLQKPAVTWQVPFIQVDHQTWIWSLWTEKKWHQCQGEKGTKVKNLLKKCCYGTKVMLIWVGAYS